jgi:hypothetical protein
MPRKIALEFCPERAKMKENTQATLLVCVMHL